MSLTNRSAALAAGAALIGAAAAYFLWSRSKSAAGEGEEELTLEETRALLKELATRIAESARRMIQAGEGIKEQLQGQVDERTIMKTFILPHFETAIRTATAEVLTPYDIDEEELDAACKKYAKDEEVSRHVQTIKLLYTSLGGDVVEEISQELADQAVDVVVEFYSMLTDRFTEVEDKMAQAFQLATSPQQIGEMLQQIVFQISSQVQEEITAKYHINDGELSAMVSKVAQHPEVLEANQAFVEAQQEFLGRLGLPV